MQTHAFRVVHAIFGLFLSVAGSALAAPFAYVNQFDLHRLAVIDLATQSIVATIPVANDPFGVALGGDATRVFVSSPFANTVSVIDAASRSRIATITPPAGSAPFGLAVNPAGTRLAMTYAGDPNPGNTLAIYDTSTRALVSTATVGLGPIAVAYNPSGTRIYVVNARSDSVSVVDANSLAVVATIPTQPGPFGIALNPSGTRAYVSQPGTASVAGTTVAVIDTATNAIIRQVVVGADPAALAVNPAGTRVFVGSANGAVYVIDATSNTLAGTIQTGGLPLSVGVTSDGSRLIVLDGSSEQLFAYDPNSLARQFAMSVPGNPVALGNFISGATTTTPPSVNAPGPLSGLWWNPAESGWGISFTQRGSIIFAAWYTYDDGGNPRWYVASDCRMANASSCSGTLYQVAGPRFFGVPFNASSVAASPAGTLNVSFQGNNNAAMTYSINGQSRTVSLTRQVFQPSGTAPATNYTDLWWNPNESGWGLSVTQQFNLMFLAWYVYDSAGNPVWYVASSCAVTSGGNGCSGTLYRTTGPAFGAGFDPAQVQVFPVGSVTLTFSDGNNGMLSYLVDGVSGSKAITRQLF